MHPTPHTDTGEALTIAIIAGAALLLLIVVFIGAGASLNQRPDSCHAQPSPGTAASSIPADYLRVYQQAGRSASIAWNLLAAIGKIESDHGRSHQPGVHSGANYAGAAGPMQFGIGGAAGNTWGGTPRHRATQHTPGYATDGNHDGWANVYDPADAIPAAAHYLKAHGAPGDVRAALFAYNRSTDYVDLVMTWAARYAAHGAENITAAQSPVCERADSGLLPKGAAGKVITYARAQLGKPYVYGAQGPGAFDCSGLTMMAYRAAGISIPRTSQAQWTTEPHIQPGREQPGDLVFFPGSDGTPSQPGHVGIVTSKSHMIAAPHTGTVVQDQVYGGRADLVGFARPTDKATG